MQDIFHIYVYLGQARIKNMDANVMFSSQFAISDDLIGRW